MNLAERAQWIRGDLTPYFFGVLDAARANRCRNRYNEQKV